MEEKQYVVDALSINESWRVFRIMAEFVEGIETLSQVENAVTIFGSAELSLITFTIRKPKIWPGFWLRMDLI